MNRFILAVFALLLVATQAFVPTGCRSLARPAFVLKGQETIKEPEDGNESDAKIVEEADIPAPIAQGPEEGQIPGKKQLIRGEYDMAKAAVDGKNADASDPPREDER